MQVSHGCIWANSGLWSLTRRFVVEGQMVGWWHPLQLTLMLLDEDGAGDEPGAAVALMLSHVGHLTCRCSGRKESASAISRLETGVLSCGGFDAGKIPTFVAPGG